MVQFKKKLNKYGSAYAILVPKALIDCKVFDIGDEIQITLEKVEQKPSSEQQQIQLQKELLNPQWAETMKKVLETASEKKALKKTSLEPLRQMGSKLSLIMGFATEFSSPQASYSFLDVLQNEVLNREGAVGQ